MNINLEYYKIFYYVAKCNSITAAAQELCISQPAVSQVVKQLEDSLGAPLFIRRPKGVKLTAEGEVLFGYIKKGYEQIIVGEAKFKELLDMDNGEIRIGASDMTLEFYLLSYLEKFHQKYPKIKVIVSNAPTPETLEHLNAGRIDFGIVSSPFETKYNFNISKVKEIEDVFVAGTKFWHYKNRMMKYSDLERLPIICLEHNTSTRKYIDAFLGSNSVELKPEFELATSDMIVQFAVRNLGIGCVVSEFAQKYLESGQLFELNFDKTIPKRNFCIITQNKVPLSVAASKLLELMI